MTTGEPVPRPLRAIVAGHLCLDLTPGLDRDLVVDEGQLHLIGPLGVALGGSVAATGVALRALGVEVLAAAAVGRDALSRLTLELLAGRGVDVSRVQVVEADASTTLVLQPPGRDRTFWHHTGANVRFDAADLDLAGADLLHLGYPSLLPALWPGAGAPLAALFTRARAAGIVTSLDLAVVDSGAEDGGPDWAAFFTQVFPTVDVLTPSLDDLLSALGAEIGSAHGLAPTPGRGVGPEQLTAAAEFARDLGARAVMVTGGSVGVAVAAEGEPTAYLPARRVERVVTTTGAGDVATAGFLRARLAGDDARTAARVAIDLAAVHVSGG